MPLQADLRDDANLAVAQPVRVVALNIVPGRERALSLANFDRHVRGSGGTISSDDLEFRPQYIVDKGRNLIRDGRSADGGDDGFLLSKIVDRSCRNLARCEEDLGCVGDTANPIELG